MSLRVLNLKGRLLWFFIILIAGFVFIFLHNAFSAIYGEASFWSAFFFLCFFGSLLVDLVILFLIIISYLKNKR